MILILIHDYDYFSKAQLVIIVYHFFKEKKQVKCELNVRSRFHTILFSVRSIKQCFALECHVTGPFKYICHMTNMKKNLTPEFTPEKLTLKIEIQIFTRDSRNICLNRQTDRYGSDPIRVPFFILEFETQKNINEMTSC